MNAKRTILLLCAAQISAATVAQDPWYYDNNPFTGFGGGNEIVSPNQWVGGLFNSDFNFHLMTQDVERDIDFSTASRMRMRLYGNHTTTVGSFPMVNTHGFLGISQTDQFFTNPVSPGPFSRIHLIEDIGINAPVVYAQDIGYRPWMRNGITMTGNSDQCYIGHKYLQDDDSDLVLQWSDNTFNDPWGVDRLRFLFTTEYNPVAQYGAASEEGLESFRVYVPGNREALVGVGDWFGHDMQVGLTDPDPSERFDVLDRTIRIRSLADVPDNATPGANYERPNLERFVVADPNDGRLYWRDVNSISDCDWEFDSATNELFTAWDPALSASCPDIETPVGIGENSPMAKLHVEANDRFDDAVLVHNSTNTGSGSSTVGIRATVDPASSFRVRGVNVRTNGGTWTNGAGDFIVDGNADYVWGVGGHANGGATTSIGVQGRAAGNATNNYGTYGVAALAAVPPATINPLLRPGRIGAVGVAFDGDPSNEAIGVYGCVGGQNPSFGINKWAGYFCGDVQVEGNMFNLGTQIFSDRRIKKNIQPVDRKEALDIIEQLKPSTYELDLTTFPHAGTLKGERFGLIAQEVEKVIPGLVGSTRTLSVLDKDGRVAQDGMDLKAVNYIEIIPLLVAGIQQQQELLNDQQSVINEMRKELTTLRADVDKSGETRNSSLIDGQASGALTDLTITPNPFDTRTTLHFRTDDDAMAKLSVADVNGISVTTLFEGMTSENRSVEWNTEDLPSGMYYISLFMNDELVVKKAVKLR